jgi:hypothetical protein
MKENGSANLLAVGGTGEVKVSVTRCHRVLMPWPLAARSDVGAQMLFVSAGD